MKQSHHNNICAIVCEKGHSIETQKAQISMPGCNVYADISFNAY